MWSAYSIDNFDHKYEGEGIVDGEEVEVEVDLKEGSFKVIVEGKVRASIDKV